MEKQKRRLTVDPYKMVARILEEEIRTGQYPNGKILSEKEIRTRFGVYSMTAQRVLYKLETRGVAQTRMVRVNRVGMVGRTYAVNPAEGSTNPERRSY